MHNTHSPKHRALPTPAIIALHAEANHSDPFARGRMSMTLRTGQDRPDAVAEDARRLLAARHARIEEDDKAWKRSDMRKEVMKMLKPNRKEVNGR